MNNLYMLEEVTPTEKMSSIIDSLEILSTFAESSELYFIQESIDDLKKNISQVSNLAIALEKSDVENSHKVVEFIYSFIRLSKKEQGNLLSTIDMLDNIKKN